MKYFKVYAQCTTRPNEQRIIELSKEEVNSIINNEVLNNEDYSNVEWNGDLEDDNELDRFFLYITERLNNLFEELNYIDCGDFRVMQLEDNEEIEIPCCCDTSMAALI